MADLKTTNIYGDAYINNKVGINTNTPATRLQIGQLSPTAATEGIQFGDDTSTRIYRGAAGQINFNGTINVLGNTYLGDANGDTVFVNDTIRIGATDSGDASLFFGEGSVAGSDYGLQWYWDSGYTFYWYTRNAGTNTALFDYVTNDTSYVNWRRNFHMQNKEINYAAQVHFNAGTRFTGNNTNYLTFKSDATNAGGIVVQDGNNTTKGYTGYWEAGGGGILNNTGNWVLRYNFGNANSGGTLYGDWAINGNISAANLSGTNTGDQTVGNGTITIAAGTGIGVGTTNTFTTNQSGATTVTVTNNGVTSNVAGTGISVSGATGAVTITNSGVTSITTNTGLSTNASATGAVTITNSGVTSNVAGTGISVSGATGAVTITNSGVTSAVAGTGVSVSAATGAVTFSIGQAVGTGNSPTFVGLSAAYIGVNNTTSTNGYGVSLYNGASAGEPTYGLMFQGTSTFGTYGSVTGDWATYFTMNNDNSRGWIFRKAATGNVASISAGGNMTLAGELFVLSDGIGAYKFMKYGGTRSGDWQLFTTSSAGAGQMNVIEVQNIGGGSHTNYPTGVYTYGGVMSWRLANHSFQLYAAHTGDLAYKTQWNNDNYSGWRRILDSSNYPYAANMNQYVRTTDTCSFAAVTATTFTGALSGNATTATTLQTARAINGVSFNGSADITVNGLNYNVNNAWLRENGDDAQFQMYGNSRTMIYRTDGNTNAHGGGGYAHIFYYGGSADNQRMFIINTDGRLWSNYHGWLDTMNISGNAATVTNGIYTTNYYTGTPLGKRRYRIHSSDSTSLNSSITNLECGFTYGGSGEPTGPFIAFGGLGGSIDYSCQLVGAYSGGGNDFKIRTRNDDTATWNTWRTIITDGNYTSYSPSLTGAGSSGTWSINITGNAATATSATNATTAGGLAVQSGTNYEANKIVRTDGNGYIQAGWINTTSGDNGTTAIDRVYASSDAYIRYYTPANFRTVLDVPTRAGSGASGNWGINITGNAATATTAATANAVASAAVKAAGLDSSVSFTMAGLTSNGTINIFPTYASSYSYFLRMGYDNSGYYDYTIKRNGTTGFLEFNGTQTNYVSYYFVLNGTGGLGIGVSPSSRLHVNGDGTNPAIRIDNGAIVTGVASNSKTFYGFMPISIAGALKYIQLWT